MNYSVTQAARVVGKSRATIIRAIAAGTLSATRDEPGKPWMIDGAELHRVFAGSAREPISALPRTADDLPLNDGKDALIAAHETTIADLRRRLDVATDQLGSALAQIHQLTDQRTKSDQAANLPVDAPAQRRRWWQWRFRKRA